MAAFKLYSMILPLCAWLVAGAFVACWRWKREQRDLLWMAGCFGLFGTGVSAQILEIPPALDSNAVLSAMLYHAAVWCQAEAMTRRFAIPMQRVAAAVVAMAAVAVLAHYAWLDDQLFVRIYVLNFGLALQLGLSTRSLWRAPAQTRLEKALKHLFAVFVLSFFVRTVLTMPEREGLTFLNFGFTTFWVVLQLSLLVFAMLFAMLYLAIAVQQALAQLQDERNRDHLTQLLNRRAFHETLMQLPVAVPSSSLGTVMLCDVDHFKQINDRWGHATGDTVLQHVARVLARNVRESDVVARYGGEEFIVLLRGTTLADAAQLAQRLCHTLAHTPLPMLPAQQRITASFGLASVHSYAELPQAIAQADAQLYAAKTAGRNQVQWLQSAPASPPASAPISASVSASSAQTQPLPATQTAA